MVTIFAPSQVNVPRLRDFACVIADVNMEDVEKRYADGITGTRIRNQFYYDLMRCKPHYPGTGNVAAPGFVRAGCEAAFPWQKKGTAYSEMAFTDEHHEAYESSPMPEDDDVQEIMNLLVENVVPE